MQPPPPSGRAFTRLYYATAALLLVALACLPVLKPLSFALLGFEQGLIEAYTPEAFQAYRATAPLRRGFSYGVGVLATAVLVLSAAALVLRRRGRLAMPWPVPAALALVAVLAAALVFVALITPRVVLCC
jgi:hypothetical protein